MGRRRGRRDRQAVAQARSETRAPRFGAVGSFKAWVLPTYLSGQRSRLGAPLAPTLPDAAAASPRGRSLPLVSMAHTGFASATVSPGRDAALGSSHPETSRVLTTFGQPQVDGADGPPTTQTPNALRAGREPAPTRSRFSKSRRGWLALAGLLAGIGVSGFSAASALAVKEYVPEISFGEPCSGSPCGPGQLKEPSGVAVNNTTGDVYVADQGDDRVEQYSSTGVFLAQFNGSAAPTGVFSAPEYVAVDNSGSALDSSKEDVYVADSGHHVVDRFGPAGEYLGQLTGTCPAEGESQAAGKCVPSGVAVIPFGKLDGIAAGAAGELWVHDNTGNFDEFTNTGEYATTFNLGAAEQPGGLALDSEGDIYATFVESREALKLSPLGEDEAEFAGGGVTGLAVASSTDDVLVDKGSGLELYGPVMGGAANAHIQLFAAGLGESHGVAVNGTSATQTAFASERSVDDVRSFNYLPFPTVTTPTASEVSDTTETLGGTVEPEGEVITECQFEYGFAKAEPGHYEHSVSCAQETGSITGVSVNVSQTVSGLVSGATYHYRVVVSNKNGAGNSTDATFTLFPVVGGESFSGVGSASAVLHATVEPGGVLTTYFFEYGTGAGYGSRTPVESAGASSQAVAVSASLEGLAADTTYHFRVVASSSDGTEDGGDVVFRTFPAAISGLPDGRGYEMVSPIENGYAEVVSGTRAAADGGAVAYLGQAPEVGGNGNNAGPNETGLSAGGGENQYLASRSAAGWTAADIQPAGLNSANYVGFSSDLSIGALVSEEPVTPGGPTGAGGGEGPAGLYTREAGGYRLLGENASYVGSTPDGSHVLLQKGHELFETAGGALAPVNVLPGGGLAANASFGGPPYTTPDLSNVVSGDGSRVFWSEEEPLKHAPLRLFVSEDAGTPGERTVQLDATEPGCVPCTSGGGGLFLAASSDGSKVFFTDEHQLTRDSNAAAGAPDLYEYDLDTSTLTDLTPATSNPGEHANVVGVLGASSDGAYVYFAAAGSLAGTGATPQECTTPIEAKDEPVSEAIKCNVYVLHDGEAPQLVTTVTNFDGEGGIHNVLDDGDWRRLVGHASFVSGDGRVLVFKSIEDLTGFDSLEDQEIYSYEYGVGLTCVSCNPSGAPTIHGEPYFFDAELPERDGGVFASRDVSADGDRVFFETAEALVPQDGNGKTDVYEWERDGTGSCIRTPGCLYLLSGGTSSHNSHLVDASENGDDVFFTSDAELVPADRGEYFQLYDARVGASEPLALTACTGTGCQGVPPAPPIFATPPSVTFSGVGNFPPPTPAAVKPPVKKKAKCPKGKTRNKKGRCIKKTKKATFRKSNHGKGSK
jgi:hypothetical protein